MDFYITSAKTGINIEQMFEEIARKALSRQQAKLERMAEL